jgi:hypothetical protein
MGIWGPTHSEGKGMGSKRFGVQLRSGLVPDEPEVDNLGKKSRLLGRRTLGFESLSPLKKRELG